VDQGDSLDPLNVDPNYYPADKQTADFGIKTLTTVKKNSHFLEIISFYMRARSLGVNSRFSIRLYFLPCERTRLSIIFFQVLKRKQHMLRE